MLVVVVINYLNAKKTTGLSKVFTAKELKVDDGKFVGVGNSSGKLPYY